MSVLHDVVEEGNDVRTLRDLLVGGLDVNIRTSRGTPLTLLASNSVRDPRDIENGLHMTRLLLRFGANINAANAFGFTPLINAIRVRNCKLVELLLEANAEVNVRDYIGNTALHHAVIGYNAAYLERNSNSYIRKIRIFKRLMRYDCDLDSQNNTLQTPLMKAVGNQDYLIVKELLKRDVSVDLEDYYHKPLMQYALDQVYVVVNIVLELVRYGCPFPISNGSEAMVLYIRKLSTVSKTALEEAKKVLKVYIFDRRTLTRDEKKEINRMRRERRRQLSKLLKCCLKEISEMEHDEIVPNYYVYNMALRGIYYRNVENYHLPHEVFDEVLIKLLEGQYPVYCDFIMSGICRPYLNTRFAKICRSNRNTGREFLSLHSLYMLASYLSHRDMYNMMLACCFDCQVDERIRRRNICSIA